MTRQLDGADFLFGAGVFWGFDGVGGLELGMRVWFTLYNTLKSSELEACFCQ